MKRVLRACWRLLWRAIAPFAQAYADTSEKPRTNAKRAAATWSKARLERDRKRRGNTHE